MLKQRTPQWYQKTSRTESVWGGPSATHRWTEPAGPRVGSTTPPGWSGSGSELKDRNTDRVRADQNQMASGLAEVLLTDVSQVDQAVLADVGAGAGLRRDDGATTAALPVADDAKLRRSDPARQVHIEDGAELLQQLQHSSSQSDAATQHRNWNRNRNRVVPGCRSRWRPPGTETGWPGPRCGSGWPGSWPGSAAW